MTKNQAVPNGQESRETVQADIAWRAVIDATQGAYEVLAELARDADGAAAFVGRPLAGGDLVILKLEPEPVGEGESPRYTLFELKKLDDTVPAPRISCPVCAAKVAAWRGRCAACGSIIGAGTESPVATDVLLAFYQFVSGTYDVVGELATEGSGPPAYLVRTRGDQHFLVLRLALGGTVAGGHQPFVVDVLPLPAPGEVPAPPTRIPLDIAPPTAIIAATTSSPNNRERVCPQCGSLFGAGTLFCPRDGASLRLVTNTGDLVGQLIDDRYYVEQRLGEGGMGEVYIAHQVRTGRKCALKLMHRSMTQDPDAVGRFRREAASACAISHPNVATIFDSGETLDQRPYFAMEYIDGRSLSQVIRDEGPLDPWRAADIARQIAEGLAAAHDLDIIHRDLKPDNVMLGAARGGADYVKLVDFGIAKPTKGMGNTLTKTGFILGTPAYMSPEQLCGDKLDGRTDLYSLGCVLHEMLTGEAPFAGQSLEMVMMRRLTEPPPHPRAMNEHVPEVLDEIVARLLGRSADERYPDARAVSAVLGAAQDAMGGPIGTANTAGYIAGGGAGSVRTPTPGPRMPSSVQVTTGGRPPRRSRDDAPPPPLSPAIPFRPPSLGQTASAASELTPSGAGAVPRPGSRRVTVTVVATIVVAGAGFAAWRIMGKSATPTISSPAPPSAPVKTAPAPKIDSTSVAVAPTPVEQPTSPPAHRRDSAATLKPQATKPQPQRQQPGAPSVGPLPPVVPAGSPAGTTSVTQSPAATGRNDVKAIDVAPVTQPAEQKAVVDVIEVERGKIREAVDAYVRGIGAKRLDDLLKIFPGMTQQVRDGYERLFRDASDLSAQIIGTPNVSIHGTTADAQFVYEMKYRTADRGTQVQQLQWAAKLQRADQGWVITSIAVQR